MGSSICVFDVFICVWVFFNSFLTYFETFFIRFGPGPGEARAKARAGPGPSWARPKLGQAWARDGHISIFTQVKYSTSDNYQGVEGINIQIDSGHPPSPLDGILNNILKSTSFQAFS